MCTCVVNVLNVSSATYVMLQGCITHSIHKKIRVNCNGL